MPQFSTARIYYPGEFGEEVNTEVTPYPTIVASSTVNTNLGTSTRLEMFRYGFVSCITTLPVAGGTLTVQWSKYDSTNSYATVNLTATQDITASTQTLKKNFQVARLASLTDPQMRLQPSDTLYAAFACSSTITTQPVGGVVGAELVILGETQLQGAVT